MKPIQEVDCKECKGKGHKLDEDGIKEICRKCDGLAKVCKCHHYPLWTCPDREEL